jgi:fructose-1,6-bisphosphatase I
MGRFPSLEQHLADWSGSDATRAAVAAVLRAVADTAGTVAEIIASGPLAGPLATSVGENADGDTQMELDVRADALFEAALRETPVAAYGSEERETALLLDRSAPLAVAIDPLDGSSNIDTNVSIGTIFAILPMTDAARQNPDAAFGQPGARQLAAGFVVYGPRTTLVLTLGQGTQMFTFDRTSDCFVVTCPHVQIPPGRREYAINASNYRHWDEPVKAYIDDCLSGEEGPRGGNFNMRWIASLVADAFRILVRGGIFLYPRDARPGYREGRLRLVYEANPIALIVEQAGGAATDGERRILDIEPAGLHQRVPLVFGSRDKVERVARYHSEPHGIGERSPLFGRRGLFRN